MKQLLDAIGMIIMYSISIAINLVTAVIGLLTTGCGCIGMITSLGAVGVIIVAIAVVCVGPIMLIAGAF